MHIPGIHHGVLARDSDTLNATMIDEFNSLAPRPQAFSRCKLQQCTHQAQKCAITQITCNSLQSSQMTMLCDLVWKQESQFIATGNVNKQHSIIHWYKYRLVEPGKQASSLHFWNPIPNKHISNGLIKIAAGVPHVTLLAMRGSGRQARSGPWKEYDLELKAGERETASYEVHKKLLQ